MEQVNDTMVRRPPALLAPYVDSIIGYRMHGYHPGEHVGMPSRHLTFVISFDDQLELSLLPGSRRQFSRFDALLGGLHTSRVVIRHDGKQHGIMLAVTPAGARALFGLPAGALASEVVPLDVLWGRLAGELLDRLDAAPAAWAPALRRRRGGAAAGADGARRDPLRRQAGDLRGMAAAGDDGWPRRHRRPRRRGGMEPAPPHRALHRRVRRRAQAARSRAAFRAVQDDARATGPARRWPASPPSAATPTRRTWRGTGATSPVPARRSGWLTNSSQSSKTTTCRRADDGLMDATVWPVLNYRDARAASAFLAEAFGFVETLVVPGESDDVVVHGELRWPEGGGVMFGTAGRDDSEFSRLPTSCASVYVVTADPRGVHDRAVAAGSEDHPRAARRGLRLDRFQRCRSRGQHLELRHVHRRVTAAPPPTTRAGAARGRGRPARCRGGRCR